MPASHTIFSLKSAIFSLKQVLQKEIVDSTLDPFQHHFFTRWITGSLTMLSYKYILSRFFAIFQKKTSCRFFPLNKACETQNTP
jgi:hypothetical protein